MAKRKPVKKAQEVIEEKVLGAEEVTELGTIVPESETFTGTDSLPTESKVDDYPPESEAATELEVIHDLADELEKTEKPLEEEVLKVSEVPQGLGPVWVDPVIPSPFNEEEIEQLSQEIFGSVNESAETMILDGPTQEAQLEKEALDERVSILVATALQNGRSSAAEDLDDHLTEESVRAMSESLAASNITFQFYEKNGKQKVQFAW